MCNLGCEVYFTIDLSHSTSLQVMFANIPHLESIYFSPSFQTNNIKNISNLFDGCDILESINISNFNTSNVVDMRRMFSGIRITSIDLSHFNTSNVKYMTEMFYNTFVLNSLNLSNFNTENVIEMTRMFYECNCLRYLDITSFTINDINDNFKLMSQVLFPGTIILKREYIDKVQTIPSSWTKIPVD